MFGGAFGCGADCFSKGDVGTAAGSFAGLFGTDGVSGFGADCVSGFGAPFVSGEDCNDADVVVALLIDVLWVGVDKVSVTFLNGSKS